MRNIDPQSGPKAAAAAEAAAAATEAQAAAAEEPTIREEDRIELAMVFRRMQAAQQAVEQASVAAMHAQGVFQYVYEKVIKNNNLPPNAAIDIEGGLVRTSEPVASLTSP